MPKRLMPKRIWAISLAVVFASSVLAACDESEQGRVLRYEKGTYLGQTDGDLNAEQLEELRHRATLQGGS